MVAKGKKTASVAKKAPVLHSDRFGDFNLAKDADRKRLKKVVVNLDLQTRNLVEHDISRWRQACQRAIDVEYPNRTYLYDIYHDVELDNHLSGTIGQINGFVKCRSFKLVNEAGDADKDALRMLDKTWFKDLMDYVLESFAWGHSLVELGDVLIGEDGMMSFNGVKLIPRNHVVPEYGRVTRIAGDDWRNGIDYRQAPYSDWMIEAGKSDNLGLYCKAAMHTIPKKYALSFWDTFAEMFGIPIRIAKTSVRDEGEKAKMADMMENMGAKAWGVFDDSTEIELVESSRGDSFNVYDMRVERANSEMSKLVLNQTMTIDDGSSLSQSQVHLKVFNNLIEAYCDFVRDIVNGQLLPKMVRHGFPVTGLTFEWDYSVDYTPEQQVAYETMILNNYEVPGSYFEDKYGVPAGERRSQQPQLQATSPFFD